RPLSAFEQAMLIAFKLKLALACVAGLAGPAKRWIANYERENARDTGSATRPFDAFGVNENGLSDLAGKVWEWTATCFDRSVLDEGGRAVKTNSNCGVRIAEGAHRAYITDFIRDARAGGCAAGTPPSNLGFRLVVDDKKLPAGNRTVERTVAKLARVF